LARLGLKLFPYLDYRSDKQIQIFPPGAVIVDRHTKAVLIANGCIRESGNATLL
jgi:hypothetical protein